MAFKAPRGTEDLLGGDILAWEAMQAIAKEIFSHYGYTMVETPIFEHLEVFARGMGEATDVVDKEMFHTLSKNAFDKVASGEPLDHDQNLALRPEGTAGVVRCVVEHNLVPTGGPVQKLMYMGQMFRCERQQKGRLRQFHQIGAECIGAEDPSSDAEMIIMLLRFYEAVGVPCESMRVLLNSMGDDECRPAYRQTIRDYILDHVDGLCDDCRRRAQTNPLRAFDCKKEGCAKVMDGAPKISESLCDDCRDHYDKVKGYLDMAGVVYEEDPRLVRGLDYYTRTVFEVQADYGLGSQNAIGGGGRYDKLVEVMGGKPTPGIGFALGFERTYLALQAAGAKIGRAPASPVYVARVDSSCDAEAFRLVSQLRDIGVAAEMDHQGRSLKSQFKQANRLGSAYTVVLGPDELSEGCGTIRSMDSHEERKVALGEIASMIAAELGV